MNNSGIPFYNIVPHEFLSSQEDDLSADDWNKRYELSKSSIIQFVGCRDPYIILAKTALRQVIESGRDKESTVRPIELHELEILQSIILAVGFDGNNSPASPGALTRLWKDLGVLPKAHMSRQVFPEDTPALTFFRRRVQLQTIAYRFLFDEQACVEVMKQLLARLDAEISGRHNFAECYAVLVHVSGMVRDRIEIYLQHVRRLMSAKTKEAVLKEANYFCSLYPAAARAWHRCAGKDLDLESLRWAVYQISELANPWIFTVPRERLIDKCGAHAARLLERLSYRAGEFDEAQIDKFPLSNPVWRRPFLSMPDGDFFCALPQCPYSFPFQIVEELIGADVKLAEKYSSVKAAYLEDKIAEVFAKSAPSARVYRNVVWDDPETGVRYENDVLAVIGNFMFMFEAKSGKINPGARRGAEKSLKNDLQSLFIDPAAQAQRLQNYLNAHHENPNLREKETGKSVELDLTRPKLVYRFSICFEHFARLTSTKHNFQELGFVDDETPWAPVLSLGEFMIVSKHLDSEVSFIHYLTRRFTIEKLLNFEGDEQDLLSLFLANGFCISKEGLGDQRVTFIDADELARAPKISAEDRKSATVYGVDLPPLWKATIAEIYKGRKTPNTFDIISTILNQAPLGLMGLQKNIKRWRRGGGGASNPVQYVKFSVGDRSFYLIIVLRRLKDFNPKTWHDEARMIAMEAGSEEDGLTDSVVFAYLSPSRNLTHDAASFFRFTPRPVGRLV
ncbi:MAG: hypothetical protein NXH82_07445 [Rhodobacteraceae bacterium]|nr:hypothetical protein [Paracoccaceae bacterium]